MIASFNLVDQPWLPCVMAEDGSLRYMGMREVLARAPTVRELVDPAPIVTVALHRLLLAVLHSNFGPANPEEWARLWRHGSWDDQVLSTYLSKWHGRFELFTEERPFYQDSTLDFQYENPIPRRAREIASYTHPTLFDHTPEHSDIGITAAEAARFLVGHHAFTVGGLVSLERGQDPKIFKSADAGPLNKGAVGLIRGATLFETLMLNLLRYTNKMASPSNGRARIALPGSKTTHPEVKTASRGATLTCSPGRAVASDYIRRRVPKAR